MSYYSHMYAHVTKLKFDESIVEMSMEVFIQVSI